MKPLVSVIIPLYNTEAYITEAISSALRQTYEQVEVLVIDDASTDRSVSAVQSLCDPRIKLLQHETNQGVSAARNTALNASQGTWIALLDADDWLGPDHLSYLLQVAEIYHAHMAADDQVFVSENGAQQNGTLFSNDRVMIQDPTLLDPVEFLLCKLAGFPTTRPGLLKPIIQRQFLEESGLCYQHLSNAEDYLFYCFCLMKGARFVIAPEAHYFYRHRQGSISNMAPLSLLRSSRQLAHCLLEEPFVQNHLTAYRGVTQGLANVEREISCLEMRALLKSGHIQPLLRQPRKNLSVLPYFGYRAAQNLFRKMARIKI